MARNDEAGWAMVLVNEFNLDIIDHASIFRFAKARSQLPMRLFNTYDVLVAVDSIDRCSIKRSFYVHYFAQDPRHK